MPGHATHAPSLACAHCALHLLAVPVSVWRCAVWVRVPVSVCLVLRSEADGLRAAAALLLDCAAALLLDCAVG